MAHHLLVYDSCHTLLKRMRYSMWRDKIHHIPLQVVACTRCGNSSVGSVDYLLIWEWNGFIQYCSRFQSYTVLHDCWVEQWWFVCHGRKCPRNQTLHRMETMCWEIRRTRRVEGNVYSEAYQGNGIYFRDMESTSRKWNPFLGNGIRFWEMESVSGKWNPFPGNGIRFREME